MNDINFLPQTFVKVQSRQRRIYREAVLVALTMVSIGGWYMSSRGSFAEVESYAATLDNEASVLREQVNEMVRLDGERQLLTTKVRLKRELEAPLETSAIVSTLGRLMPSAVALRSVSIEGDRPKPYVAPVARAAGTAPTSTKPAEPPAPEMVKLIVVGLAPADSMVTEFVGALSSHGLFEQVKLLYSRPVTVDDVIAREFRLEMNIPFDRDFVPAEQTQGVADAR